MKNLQLTSNLRMSDPKTGNKVGISILMSLTQRSTRGLSKCNKQGEEIKGKQDWKRKYNTDYLQRCDCLCGKPQGIYKTNKKLLDLINEFYSVKRYKINMCTSVSFLYTGNEKLKIEMLKQKKHHKRKP